MGQGDGGRGGGSRPKGVEGVSEAGRKGPNE
jgi:hypothetical protein